MRKFGFSSSILRLFVPDILKTAENIRENPKISRPRKFFSADQNHPNKKNEEAAA
jgi:hypothetical protein